MYSVTYRAKETYYTISPAWLFLVSDGRSKLSGIADLLWISKQVEERKESFMWRQIGCLNNDNAV